jgi:hypothetical protein
MEGYTDIMMPQIKQAAGSVAGRPGYHPIQEIILSPYTHLQAASGERAIIDVQVGITILKLHLLRIASDSDGQCPGGVYDFLGDIGAEPAKYLFPLAPVF